MASPLRTRPRKRFSPPDPTMSRHPLGSILALLLAAGASGCLLLPIPNTHEVTPAVRGRLLGEDGTPLAGVTVAVTSRESDAGCAESRARGITDPQGRFTLA